ncbi:MAG: type II toxin-antitoxin system RelE/ParE family toxin [Rubrivivax sp.]|nr:type II toxin-antitoxin system RelE/ParE family toxin [Rubrivivax sp.]
MSYSLHPGAERDLLEAARFYQREGGARLADRFLNEFERVAAVLVGSPDIGTPTDDARRVHPLQGFPYSVIYRPMADHIRVLVVRHQHRDPGHGESRR